MKELKELKVMAEKEIAELEKKVFTSDYIDGKLFAYKELISWIDKLEKPKSNEELTPIEAFDELIKQRDEIRKGWEPNRNGANTNWKIGLNAAREWVMHRDLDTSRIFTFETFYQTSVFYKNNEKLFKIIKQLY